MAVLWRRAAASLDGLMPPDPPPSPGIDGSPGIPKPSALFLRALAAGGQGSTRLLLLLPQQRRDRSSEAVRQLDSLTHSKKEFLRAIELSLLPRGWRRR